MKNTNTSYSKLSFGIILFGTVAALSVGCTSPSDNPEVLAWSDLGIITQADLDAHILGQLEEQQRPKENQDPSEWRRAHLTQLLVRKAVAAKNSDSSEGDNPKVASILADAMDRILAGAFVEEVEESLAEPTEDEVRAFFESHQEEFGHEEQIRLRNIFKRVDRGATQKERNQKRAEIETLLNQIRAGTRFEDLARTQSDSETARMGGLIGRLDRGQLEPAVENLVWSLNEGEVSEIVTTPVGFHIFKVETRVAPRASNYDDAREALRQRMHDENTQIVLAETFKELLSSSGAVYQPGLMDSDHDLGADDVLFEIDDRRITGADAAKYARNASFGAFRNQSLPVWLEDRSKDLLFAWNAEQLKFDDRPEIHAQKEETRIQILVNRELANRMSTELDRLNALGELESFYRDDATRFQTRVMHKIQIVTLNLADFDPPFEAFELLKSLASDVREGHEDLADAARQLSTDPSASRGGRLGWIPLTSFGVWAGPRAQKTVAKLNVGEVSDPFLIECYDPLKLRYVREAYAVVKIEDIRPSTLPSFEEALPQVRSTYLSAHRVEIEERVQMQILNSINATILEDRL
jgi:parvulin-like peptidyl-prolyl isomerase